jgi:hypothetical protein
VFVTNRYELLESYRNLLEFEPCRGVPKKRGPVYAICPIVERSTYAPVTLDSFR